MAVMRILPEEGAIGVKRMVALVRRDYPHLEASGVRVGAKEVKAAKETIRRSLAETTPAEPEPEPERQQGMGSGAGGEMRSAITGELVGAGKTLGPGTPALETEGVVAEIELDGPVGAEIEPDTPDTEVSTTDTDAAGVGLYRAGRAAAPLQTLAVYGGRLGVDWLTATGMRERLVPGPGKPQGQIQAKMEAAYQAHPPPAGRRLRAPW
jgi:hypothetical protein